MSTFSAVSSNAWAEYRPGDPDAVPALLVGRRRAWTAALVKIGPRLPRRDGGDGKRDGEREREGRWIGEERWWEREDAAMD